jgi:four helix bundle protein
MLRIYPVILEWLAELAPLIERIAHHDPDLARQLKRSSRSVALNTAEGMYARGRTKTACYNTALREMRESFAALEVSVRLRYLQALVPTVESRSRHIIGTLYKLSFPT